MARTRQLPIAGGRGDALVARRLLLLAASIVLCWIMGFRAAPAGGQVPAGEPQRVIRVALPNPYSVKGLLEYAPDGSVDGFAKRLMDAIAAEAGVRVEYVEYKADVGSDVLARGEVDAVCPLSIQEARLVEAQFTSPIMVAGGAAYGRPGSEPATSAAALRGKRVVVTGAGIAEQWCAEHSIPCAVRHSVREVLQAVLNGEADYAVTTIPGARLTQQVDHISGLVEYPIDDETFRRAYGIGVRHADTDLLQTLDGALAAVRARGEFERLYSHWAAKYQPAPSSGLVPTVVLIWVAGVGGGLLLVAMGAYGLTQRRLVARTSALLRSEERFRQFVECSTEAVWSFEVRPPVPISLPPEQQVEHLLERGVLTDCNKATADLYGRGEPDAMLGTPLRDLVGCDDPTGPGVLRAFVDAAYRLGGAETTLRLPGSRERAVVNSLVGLVDDGRLQRVWVTQIDVSARRAAERRLRDSESQYRLLTENLGALTYTYVIYDNGRRELRFATTQLAQWQRQFPWLNPGEAFERSYGPYIHPDDLPAYAAAVRRSREQYVLLDVEFRLLAVDGTYRVLHTKVVPMPTQGGTFWTAMVTDVTNIRASEQARRDTERRYREVFERSHDAIVIFSPQDGRVLDCNDRACALYGFSRDELIGLDLRSLAVDPDVSARRIAETLERGFHDDFPCHQRRKDGTEMEVDISASVIEVADRPAILIMVRDITERVRAEQQRQALERDLREARRLESLGVLAGGVAHDFNNLLAAILGNADLALLHAPQNSRAREHLEMIIAASRSAAGLTRQMLMYSGGGSMTREPVDLANLARGVVRMMAVTVGRHASLGLRLAEALPPVIGDRALLSQLLMNLITNSADAIGHRPGGEILVAVQLADVDPAELSPTYTAPEFAGGRCVCLEVRDTGQGMSDEVRERMFEPFFTTKFTGRGLGLAATLGTVRSHGGAIQVESRVGFGTMVRVFLPPSHLPAPIPEPPSTPRSAGDTPRRAGSILVVDDDPLVRGVVVATLAADGWDTRECADGNDAFRAAADPADALAAAVIDLTMPGTDGAQVAAGLRLQRPALPLVIMSGYSDATERGGIERIPGAVFLHKPFTTEELLAALDRAAKSVAAAPAPAARA